MLHQRITGDVSIINRNVTFPRPSNFKIFHLNNLFIRNNEVQNEELFSKTIVKARDSTSVTVPVNKVSSWD